MKPHYRKGKTLEELFGVERAKEMKRKQSETTKKQFKNSMPEETKEKIRKSRTGKKHSKETIEIIRENTKKQWQDPEIRKKRIESLLGHEVSEKTRRIIGLKNTKEYNPEKGRKISKKRKKLYELGLMPEPWAKNLTKKTDKRVKRIAESKEGKKHWNWLGGKSFEPYGLEFNEQLKEFIRQRDNYTCQECGYNQKQLGYKLTVHHIDFDKKNNNPKNLISLCKSCHSQTNFNREDWVKYFQEGVIKYGE